MTHVAWVPPEWLDAAERTLAGMAERHPSRTVILVPRARRATDGIDAELSVRCFPVGDRDGLRRGDRARTCAATASRAPASIVAPARDLRPAGLPALARRAAVRRGAVGRSSSSVADRRDRRLLGVGRAPLRRARRARSSGPRSPTSPGRGPTPWRVELAAAGRRSASRRSRCAGPRAEAALLRGWLATRLERELPPVEPAGEIGVAARRGRGRAAPRRSRVSPSDLLSAELDRLAPRPRSTRPPPPPSGGPPASRSI